MKDKQRSQWFLTINHPKEHGFTHEDIKRTVSLNFPTIAYYAVVDEEGSCYHSHLYLYFTSRVRFSTVKKYFPVAHIEEVKGSFQDMLSYLKKSGKWEKDGSKQEQKVEGSFEEWGTRPKGKEKNAGNRELFEMLKAGYTNCQILEENADYIKYFEKMDRIRTGIKVEEYKNKIRMDLKVIYIYGATGTGKTRGVLEKHKPENVYRINEYIHPFDEYQYQDIILFDEFRDSLKLSDMLCYLDIYPVSLPARYENRFACFSKVYIVSNWSLEAQYGDLQKKDRESWEAFLRRIHEVYVYHKDGKITKYDSVDSYLKRDEKFTALTREEEEQVKILFEEKGEKEENE